MPEGANAKGKLVAALRRMGFDEVYDTNFAADLTVMEESAELLERLEKNENYNSESILLGLLVPDRILKGTLISTIVWVVKPVG